MDKNLHQKSSPVIQETTLSKTVREKKKKLVVRAMYIAGGSIALGLAFLGFFVPGLPVTPLALLAAWLYAKGSEKLYNWLLNNKFLGKRIKNYHRKKGVSRKGKIGVIALMTLMVLFSSFVVIRDNLTIRYIILSLGAIGVIVVWFFVPNARNIGDYPKEE